MEVVNRRSGPRPRREPPRDPTGKLNEKEFDSIVRRWNAKSTKKRHVRAICLSEGHQFREVPFSEPNDQLMVCVRCCDYRRGW